MSEGEINIDEIVENLIGFSDRIDTPFGEICSLACDLGQMNRLYKPIEQSIEKLYKHLTQRYERQTFQGSIFGNLQNFSTNVILEYFGMKQTTHKIIQCNSHDFSPYIALGKLLRVNCPTLRGDIISNPDTFQPAHVYVSPQENSFNILPWKYYNCTIELIEEKEDLQQISALNLIDKLSEASESDLHIVSLSIVNSMTGQKITNLPQIVEIVLGLRAEMQKKNKNIRIYLALDITQTIHREKILVNSSFLKDIDFFIFNPTKVLGGGNVSANFLICRLDNQFTTFAPQIPINEGRFDALDNLEDNNNVTSLYRAALQLQLIESLKPERLSQFETKNVELFISQIKKINEELQIVNPQQSIRIWGMGSKQGKIIPNQNNQIDNNQDTTEKEAQEQEEDEGQNQQNQEPLENTESSESISFTYGNLNLTLNTSESDIFDEQSRSYIHPQLVCQILHDLFGVQAYCKINILLKEQVLLLNIPSVLAQELGALGSSEVIKSCVGIDISFLHKENEIIYVANALKLVCEKGQELLKFYDKKSYIMNDFIQDNYDFSLSQMQAVFDTREEFVKVRMQKYEQQLDSAQTVLKNQSRYFSLNNGFSKDKTEIFKKKDFKGCIPPTISSKVSKVDKNAAAKKEIIDQKKLNILRIAIERIEIYLNQEIAIFEEEKRKRLEAEKLPPPPPPIVAPPPFVPPQETEEERLERRRKAMEEAKEALQIKIQEMLASKIEEEQKKEKARMDFLIEQLRSQMEEQIDSKTNVKENFIFEDLQPSVMFKNVLDQREKRYRNLRLIFNNYAKLNQKQNEQQSRARNNQFLLLDHYNTGQNNYLSGRNKDDEQNEKTAFTINLQQYILFCSEFNLSNEIVDANVLNQIYSRSLIPNRDKQVSSKEMHFTEFVNSLEKISFVFFAENQNLFTNYDKMEALYQFMQIDDIQKLKKKMINTSYNYIEAKGNPPSSAQRSSFSKKNILQNHLSGYNDFENDFQMGDDTTSYPGKKVSDSLEARKSKNQYPSSFQPSNNSKSNRIASSKQYPTSEGAESAYEMKQQKQQGYLKINWNDVGGGGIKNYQNQLFKNDGNSIGDISLVNLSNNSPYNLSLQHSYNNIDSYKSQLKTPSSNYLVGNQVQSLSPPAKKNVRQTNKSLNLYYPSQALLKKNTVLERIKEVEDSEAQKQADLLSFIQQGQQNKYQNMKKKGRME